MSRLSRASIVDAALQLLDAKGLEGLTTRGLAEALGVKSPALYWHFKSMRDLLDAMAAAMLAPETWPGPATPGLRPPDWLAARARALRASLLAHRDGAAIHAGTMPSTGAPDELEARLAALVDWGLTPGDAVRATMALTRYTVGWVLEEQARARRSDGPRPQFDLAAAPTLARARAVIRGDDPDADFDFGVRALIAGFSQMRRGAPPDG